MTSIIEDQLLNSFNNGRAPSESVASLIELGREQGHVTYDDILNLFPEAEQNLAELDEVFAALQSAGIEVIEEEEEEEKKAESSSAPSSSAPKETAPEEPKDPMAAVEAKDLVGLYFKDAVRTPLLTADEEVELSKAIEQGREARARLAEGHQVSAEEETELRRQIQEGAQARKHLILANSRLVVSIAKKYTGRGVPMLDLIQEGNIGLMRAAKKFDYQRGYKFSTYATWWIRQAVTRAIANNGRTIRLPVHMGTKIARLYRTRHRLNQKFGREATVEELAEALEITPAEVEKTLQISRQPLSLEMPIDFEGDSELGDFIEDQETPLPEDTAASKITREQLEKLLREKVPAREALVLRLRFGLPDGKVHTLQEVGRKMGITRERVRQIEAQALRRLRRPRVRHRLKA